MLIWPLLLLFLALLTGSALQMRGAQTEAEQRGLAARQAQELLARATAERQRLADRYADEIECTRAVRRRALEVMRAGGGTGIPSTTDYESAAKATACHPEYDAGTHSPFDLTKKPKTPLGVAIHDDAIYGVPASSGYDPSTGQAPAGALGAEWSRIHGTGWTHTLTGMKASPAPSRVATWGTAGQPADERHVYDWTRVRANAPQRFRGWIGERPPQGVPPVCRGGDGTGDPLVAADATDPSMVPGTMTVAGVEATVRTACTVSIQTLPHQALRTDGRAAHPNEGPAPSTGLLDAAVPADGPHLAMAARAGDVVVNMAPHVHADRGHRPRGFTYPVPLPYASKVAATAGRDAPGPDRVFQGVEDALNRARTGPGASPVDCHLPYRSAVGSADPLPGRPLLAAGAGLCPPPAQAYSPRKPATAGLTPAEARLKPDPLHPRGLPGPQLYDWPDHTPRRSIDGASMVSITKAMRWDGSRVLETKLRTRLRAAGRTDAGGAAAPQFLPPSMRTY